MWPKTVSNGRESVQNWNRVKTLIADLEFGDDSVLVAINDDSPYVNVG